MELNTNNPGGIYNIDRIEKILMDEDSVIQKMKNKYNFNLYNRNEALVDSMIKYFEDFQRKIGKNLGDKFIILGDNSGDHIPYIQLKSVLERRGLDVDIVMNDDDDLVYNNRGVLYKGQRVGFVNKRIESKELVNSVKFLREASQNKKVCVFNPFSSGMLWVKKLYILLNNKDFQLELSKNSRNFINEYIPETYDFLDFISTRFNDLKNSKDKYVLKPNSGEQGNGVIVGPETSKENWEFILNKYKKDNKNLKFGKHIVQSFLDFTRIGNCTYDYNLLSINGIFFPFGRVAKDKHSKTNITQGGSYIPCFRYNHK